MSDVRIKPRTFLDLYMDDQATAEDADDAVTAWHVSGDDELRPLTEYLGMTDEEYNIWTMDRRTLPLIVAARRSGGASLVTLLTDYQRRLQAANDPTDRTALFSLGHWLRARGVDTA